MDKYELIKKLEDEQNNHDKENAHFAADSLLLEYINDKEIEKAFRKLPKWYS